MNADVLLLSLLLLLNFQWEKKMTFFGFKDAGKVRLFFGTLDARK